MGKWWIRRAIVTHSLCRGNTSVTFEIQVEYDGRSVSHQGERQVYPRSATLAVASFRLVFYVLQAAIPQTFLAFGGASPRRKQEKREGFSTRMA